MIIKKHVCDICEKDFPDVRIKYKVKAKKYWSDWGDEGWQKIEICQKCLEKIIKEEEKTNE